MQILPKRKGSPLCTVEFSFKGERKLLVLESLTPAHTLLLNSLRAGQAYCQGNKAVSPHTSLWTANVCFQPPAAWDLSPSGCRKQGAEVTPNKPILLSPALV